MVHFDLITVPSFQFILSDDGTTAHYCPSSYVGDVDALDNRRRSTVPSSVPLSRRVLVWPSVATYLFWRPKLPSYFVLTLPHRTIGLSCYCRAIGSQSIVPTGDG